MAWNNQSRFYPHDASADPYYQDPYFSSAAGAGPSRRANEMYPEVTPRMRPTTDGLPPKPPPQPFYPHNSVARPRDTSPPRTAARPSDGRRPSHNRNSSGSFSERRGGDALDNRDRDRPPPTTPRSAPLPRLEPVIAVFVEALKSQQDARKERIDIELNNAKYLKYRDRDDISKENKAKAEKALLEIEEAKKREEVTWVNVEKQTKELMAIATGQASETLRPRQELIQPVTPPRPRPTPAANAESELEPGEIAVPSVDQINRPIVSGPAPGPHPAKPSSSTPRISAPAPASATDQIEDALPARKVKERSSVTRASIMERFEELDMSLLEVQSETRDRLDQMESNMEDMVRLEVESRVRKARMAFKNNLTQRAEGKAAAAGGDIGTEGESSDCSTVPLPSNVNGRPTTASIAPVPQAPAFNGKAREDPGMSQEQVTALVESMRQQMREEFDKKLHAQQQDYQNLINTFHQQVAAQFRKDQEDLRNGFASHREALHSHQTVLCKHEELWQGTLGIFANIPKPTNTP